QPIDQARFLQRVEPYIMSHVGILRVFGTSALHSNLPDHIARVCDRYNVVLRSMESPYRHIRNSWSERRVTAAAQRYARGEYHRPFRKEIPRPVPAVGLSAQIDSPRIDAEFFLERFDQGQRQRFFVAELFGIRHCPRAGRLRNQDKRWILCLTL